MKKGLFCKQPLETIQSYWGDFLKWVLFFQFDMYSEFFHVHVKLSAFTLLITYGRSLLEVLIALLS